MSSERENAVIAFSLLQEDGFSATSILTDPSPVATNALLGGLKRIDRSSFGKFHENPSSFISQATGLQNSPQATRAIGK